MNKAHIELLEERYIEAVNGYVMAYVNKHHIANTIGWVNGRIGEVLIVDGGKRIDFRDIKDDIDNDREPVKESLATQTDNMDFMSGDEVCGNCKRGCVQSDGSCVRCGERGTMQKYLDDACNLYLRGENT